MLYGVTFQTGSGKVWSWQLYRNKRDAVKAAKVNDAEVWAHPDVPEVSAWDWPTFRIGAKRIYPI